MIHVVDEKTDEILAVLSEEEFFDDEFEENLLGLETFKFSVSATNVKASFLTSRRKIVIPGDDGEFKEFILTEPLMFGNTKEYFTLGSCSDLRKQKIIDPVVLEGQTVSTATGYVLDSIGWQIGNLEYVGIRKIEFENPMDAYDALWKIASIFGLEIHFRVEVEGNKIAKRLVDMLTKRGELSGKEVVFGKDLIDIERRETAKDLVTALKCYGPIKDDGSRLIVIVEDDEAYQKWNDNGRHLWGIYEPQSENADMTIERLTSLGKTELSKRTAPSVQYTIKTAALEHIFGYDHEKLRLGDTNRVKDESKNPPIYLDARVISVKRSIKKNAPKTVEYGDFIEYADAQSIPAQPSAKLQKINTKINNLEAQNAMLLLMIAESQTVGDAS